LSLDSGREVLDRLLERGFTAAEVYVKRGRSRRFEIDGEAEATLSADEAGWSVRAARGAASFFFAAAGSPLPLDHWPEAFDGEPLALPEGLPIADWSEPPAVTDPLLAEDEGRRVLRGVAEDLARRLPGATLAAVLEDGSSEVRILNHHGLDAGYRGRFAALRLEARATLDAGAAVATLALAERSARRFRIAAMADRLVDVLAVRARGSLGAPEGADVVLTPEVAARLLAPVAAAFVGRTRDQVADLLDARDGRVGAADVSLIDDGRHRGGPLSAPIDGEGVPTGTRVLVDSGRLESTILPWERSSMPIGCRVRPGWRDLPRVGTTQVYVAPRADTTPASLVEDLADGYYLLDAGDGGRYDLAAGRFSLPVWGFRIAGGRPLHPTGEARLVGDPRRLLHAVCGVARDLRFVPLGALVGAPTVRMRGLTLHSHG